MKRLIMICVLLAAGPLWANGDFLRTMTPEERAATGLDKLTPAELARLEAAIERYKSGEVAVVQQQAAVVQKEAETKVAVAHKEAEQKAAAVRQEAEQEAERKVAVAREEAATRIAAAEAKAKQAETRAAAPAAPETEKKPGWLKALITLDKVAKEPDSQDAVESRIAGDFKGWRRNTTFNLENGQRWQADSTEDYVTPPVKAPKVRIYPGMFNTFWMEIEGVRTRVRVKPIRLE